ncbi:MAG: DNA mismatch endonuclease Vsr [Pseudomonadota bacterium]|jgi:DNA mismatch endonuclease (patch repair protein)|nr:DNA mismatch endonuclease Vsr [Pseudomonadota bacterium]
MRPSRYPGVMDHLDKKRRSRNMAAIKDRDTAPEMIVRRLAHAMGFRFRLHRRDLPGKPDLVFPGRKSVIFVHGCFWHQHSSEKCKTRPPKSNTSYWLPKLERNVARDERNQSQLSSMGWRYLVIWECETKDRHSLASKISDFLNG